MAVRIALGLGSNIEPTLNLPAALQKLRVAFPDLRVSRIYETAPQEVSDQPDFLNAVAVAETNLSTTEIITLLQKIERQLGKAPPYRFGPRTIDLDLLLYGNQVIHEEYLTVPHPRMHERRFVLEPLAELIGAQELHPALKVSWGDLLATVPDQECDVVS